MPAALAFISDAQCKEVNALFDLLDTDRDGLLDAKSARFVCERLGFYPEPPHHTGDPGSSAATREDILSWIDNYSGQAQAKTKNGDKLRLSQRYALLRTFDVYGGGSQHRLTNKAIASFLETEQHKVRPEMISRLIEEFGDGLKLTREQLKEVMQQQQQKGQHRQVPASKS